MPTKAKAASKSKASKPSPPPSPPGQAAQLFGKPFRCLACGGDRFVSGSALLNTVGMTFLGLEWANRSATTLRCTECGYVHWFAP